MAAHMLKLEGYREVEHDPCTSTTGKLTYSRKELSFIHSCMHPFPASEILACPNLSSSFWDEHGNQSKPLPLSLQYDAWKLGFEMSRDDGTVRSLGRGVTERDRQVTQVHSARRSCLDFLLYLLLS